MYEQTLHSVAIYMLSSKKEMGSPICIQVDNVISCEFCQHVICPNNNKYEIVIQKGIPDQLSLLEPLDSVMILEINGI